MTRTLWNAVALSMPLNAGLNALYLQQFVLMLGDSPGTLPDNDRLLLTYTALLPAK